jgi:TPR repeat protein
MASLWAPSSKRNWQVGILILGALLGATQGGIDATAGQAPSTSFGDAAPLVQLLRLLAEQGDTEAQNRLGDMFWNGQDVAQDYSQAVVWYRKAADHGDATAQFNLGVAYFSGQGVPHDQKAALTWYQKAAQQGNVNAQTNLAGMYEHGWGAPQSLWEASNWYRKAADQGDPTAQYDLAMMYVNGYGVKRDYLEAYVLLNRAASGSFSPGTGMHDLALRYRDDIAKKLSPDQLTQAQKILADRRE